MAARISNAPPRCFSSAVQNIHTHNFVHSTTHKYLKMQHHSYSQPVFQIPFCKLTGRPSVPGSGSPALVLPEASSPRKTASFQTKSQHRTKEGNSRCSPQEGRAKVQATRTLPSVSAVGPLHLAFKCHQGCFTTQRRRSRAGCRLPTILHCCLWCALPKPPDKAKRYCLECIGFPLFRRAAPWRVCTAIPSGYT